VISTSKLRGQAVADRVIFDVRGEPVDTEIPPSMGEAGLLVSPVTDAVKRVHDGVVESLDRDRFWTVEAIVLGRDVLELLDETPMSADELIDAVRRLGYSWDVRPVVDP
jgi:hypothetical protein